VKPLLRLTQWLLGVSAAVLLGYWSYDTAESRLFQDRELSQISQRPYAPGTVPPAGEVIGRIDIPRLAVSVAVMEGSSAAILRHAAGHIEGTALPGQPGNTGVSAHRDTFFRPLRNIRRDDLITVTTTLSTYRYRVVSTRIVLPSNVGVLDAGRAQVLTLVTCYPFWFVGPAPDRFIVRAERVI
jgi:sortase A